MRRGIHLPHIAQKASAEAIRRAAVQAGQLGLPDARSTGHTTAPHARLYSTPGAPAVQRALRLAGWHGARATPEQAAPIVTRLRQARPDSDFAISLRSGWDGRDDATLRGRLEGYAAVGIDHVLVEPAERELAD